MEQNPDRFKGDPGQDGTNGTDGSDGVSPEIDYDQLTAEVLRRFPAFKVTRIYVDADGNQLKVADGEVKPGGYLTLYDGPGSEKQHQQMLEAGQR